MRRILTIALAGLFAALMLLPATAVARTARHRSAATADRNHDRIPDRWERRHRLSLRVKQTRRDQDHDGLANLGEFRAGTDPRDADSDDDGLRDGAERRDGLSPRDDDSDDDGVEDGDENSGRVVSFENGVLTIALSSGGNLTGNVTSDTEIECESAAPVASAASDDGDDDHSGSGGGDEDRSGPSGEDGDDHGDDDEGDDDGEACTTAALVPGAVVHEAELNVANGVAVFREIELRN